MDTNVSDDNILYVNPIGQASNNLDYVKNYSFDLNDLNLSKTQRKLRNKIYKLSFAYMSPGAFGLIKTIEKLLNEYIPDDLLNEEIQELLDDSPLSKDEKKELLGDVINMFKK